MAVPTHMKALLARSFVQQSNQGSWVFLSLAILVTIIRTYSRWMTVGFKRFQADDYLVWFALVSKPGDDADADADADSSFFFFLPTYIIQ